jgi:hypothetical protein
MKSHRSILISIVICLSAFAAFCAAYFYLIPLAYDLFVAEKPTLFSSSFSPNGSLVAENFLGPGDFGGGRVVVRRTSESSGYSSANRIELQGPEAEVFFKWSDDEHLTILTPSDARRIIGAKELDGVSLTYATYPTKADAAAKTEAGNAALQMPESSNVSATFGEMASLTNYLGTLKTCKLELTVKDGKLLDEVGVTIAATLSSCGASGLTCGQISSNFRVGRRVDGQRGRLLTSATISDIPSYNRGEGHRRIRGQFLGSNAEALVKALEGEFVELDFFFDFFANTARYQIFTLSISPSVLDFKNCVRGAKFH